MIVLWLNQKSSWAVSRALYDLFVTKPFSYSVLFKTSSSNSKTSWPTWSCLWLPYCTRRPNRLRGNKNSSWRVPNRRLQWLSFFSNFRWVFSRFFKFWRWLRWYAAFLFLQEFVHLTFSFWFCYHITMLASKRRLGARQSLPRVEERVTAKRRWSFLLQKYVLPERSRLSSSSTSWYQSTSSDVTRRYA